MYHQYRCRMWLISKKKVFTLLFVKSFGFAPRSVSMSQLTLTLLLSARVLTYFFSFGKHLSSYNFIKGSKYMERLQLFGVLKVHPGCKSLRTTILQNKAVNKCNFSQQLLHKTNSNFSLFYCNKNLPYLCRQL